MQKTSERYQQILAVPHTVGCKVNIAGEEYGADRIENLSTTQSAFGDESTPVIGKCVAGEIDLDIRKRSGKIPKKAQITVYARLEAINSNAKSEWLQQGVYFIDTREANTDLDGCTILTIHGYDSMKMAQRPIYDDEMTEDEELAIADQWPMVDTDAVKFIAERLLNCEVDERTWPVMGCQYSIPFPGIGKEYGLKGTEMLSNIGAMYAGNWIITPQDKLRLIPLGWYPPDPNLLITEDGYPITFGGVSIYVGG